MQLNWWQTVLNDHHSQGSRRLAKFQEVPACVRALDTFLHLEDIHTTALTFSNGFNPSMVDRNTMHQKISKTMLKVKIDQMSIRLDEYLFTHIWYYAVFWKYFASFSFAFGTLYTILYWKYNTSLETYKLSLIHESPIYTLYSLRLTFMHLKERAIHTLARENVIYCI